MLYRSNDVGPQHVVAHSGHKGDQINKSYCYLNEHGALVEISAEVLTGWADAKEEVHQYSMRACMTAENEEKITQLVVMLFSASCPDIVPDGRLWEFGMTLLAAILMYYPKVVKYNEKHMIVVILREKAIKCNIKRSELSAWGKLIEKDFLNKNKLALVKVKELQLKTYEKVESLEKVSLNIICCVTCHL